MSEQLPTIQFDIFRDDQLLRTEKFRQDVIKIGRLSRSHLRLEDDDVSRMQSIVEVTKDGKVVIIDLGSAKGTFVNGQKVNKCELTSGDSIKVGATTLVVRIGESAEDSARVLVADPKLKEAPKEIPKNEATSIIPAVPDAATGSPALVDSAVVEAAPAVMPDSFDELYYQTPKRDLRPDQLTHQLSLELFAIWNKSVIASLDFRTELDVIIGEEKESAVFVPSSILGRSTYDLVRFDGTRALLNLEHEGITGDVLYKGKLTPLSAIRMSVENSGGRYDLPNGAKCRLHFGDSLTLLLAFGYVTKPVATDVQLDVPWWSSNTVSLIAHVLFLIAILVFPKDHLKMKGEDPYDPRDQHFQTMLEKKQDQDQEELVMIVEQKKGDEKQQNQEMDSAKHEGKEGMRGKRDAPKVDRRSAFHGKKKEVRFMSKKERMRKELIRKSVVKIFEKKDNPLQDLYADNKEPGGPDPMNTHGRILRSKSPGDSFGYLHGKGNKGFHDGGDGLLGNKTIGTRRTGLKNYIGTPNGPGNNNLTGVKFRERRRRIRVIDLTPITQGNLPKEVIQRVMRRNRNKWKYCYVSELMRMVNLHGKIVVFFIIDGTGQVISSKISSSKMNNSKVEQCIANKVRRLRFPSPPNGGLVKVYYPFVFKSMGL